MFKLVVAGTRSFNNYRLLEVKLNRILKNITDDIQIVSGKASGADTLGENYAKKYGYSIKDFPAEWDNLEGVDARFIKTNKFGKAYNALAGHIRNEKMAKYGDACVVFWDGKSTGTADMIKLAKQHNLLLRVIEY